MYFLYKQSVGRDNIFAGLCAWGQWYNENEEATVTLPSQFRRNTAHRSHIENVLIYLKQYY